MDKCKHYDTCGLYGSAEEGLCILHSKNPEKDEQEFAVALSKHREEKGDNFSHFIFPTDADFTGAEFSEPDFSETTFCGTVTFRTAKFSGVAKFGQTIFSGAANFGFAVFSGAAHFGRSNFYKEAKFDWVKFYAGAHFDKAEFFGKPEFWQARFCKGSSFTKSEFSKGASFRWVKFSEDANFSIATFSGTTHFEGAVFKGNVRFLETSFLGRTIFLGREELQFCGVNVDFVEVNIQPPDALVFRDADLRRSLFKGTRLRKVEFTGVQWPVIHGRFTFKRFGVYDEIVPTEAEMSEAKTKEKNDKSRSWHHIERLYRDLKKNYEDQGDHERAGHFHYGEKETRRKNPQTGPMLRLFLYVYWLISGYGERYFLPVFCAAVLLILCTLGYLALGIAPDGKAKLVLKWGNVKDWVGAFQYSLNVMLLQKPENLKPIGYAAGFVKTIQSVVGPLILAFFALALRQRLKR
ncbi:MAG: pentapeptide repeat-containing protein [Planctomycetota bacterium]|jgi:uncharacterized protein YjbI with pentapeptide repeats